MITPADLSFYHRRLQPIKHLAEFLLKKRTLTSSSPNERFNDFYQMLPKLFS